MKHCFYPAQQGFRSYCVLVVVLVVVVVVVVVVVGLVCKTC